MRYRIRKEMYEMCSFLKNILRKYEISKFKRKNRRNYAYLLVDEYPNIIAKSEYNQKGDEQS